MKIRLVSDSIELTTTSFSSWLIDFYFLKIYPEEIRSNSKIFRPKNLLGFYDMFLIGQLIRSTLTFNEFVSFCQIKLKKLDSSNEFLSQYNSHLSRCGLTDLIDLIFDLQIESLTLKPDEIPSEFDRIFVEHFASKASNFESFPFELKTSKNFLRHTFCMYFSLLLDTRNEHALVHCLTTPSRQNLDRRTIVELRRLTQLKKNESLTMFQILLSFVRRKDLNSNENEENFLVLNQFSVGLKEFVDFVEQLQMKIEENEYLKVEPKVTFQQLLTTISKQLKKDSTFSRCESLIKEILDEFSTNFQMTNQLNNFSSPKRSASSGGTLAGRRFLRALAFFCAKESISFPILTTKNEHYESPSTGLKKATAARLLRSPLTPIPMAIEPIEEKVEEKIEEKPLQSVFVWENKSLPRRKSQRCLDLSTSCEFPRSDSTESLKMRRSLSEIDSNSLEKDFRSSPTLLPSVDEEKTTKKRSIASPKRPTKKLKTKVLPSGQKSIKNFFK